MTDFEVVNPEKTELVKANAEFWADYSAPNSPNGQSGHLRLDC
jgi:hypothetical protein